ncbi:MAG: aminotransferase class I/II-fold pyridoxal phosphate-dependent enzyme [Elainella sp.]
MKLPAFELERYFARHEFTAPYLLCSSDCESVAIQDLLALEPEATEAFHQVGLGYTETAGSPSLRAEICRSYEAMQPEQILVCAGAEEAIFLFMNAVLNSGDHLIVHAPGYQSHQDIARSIGCEVSLWYGREAADWSLDLDELCQLIRPQTKAIVINCPHNPTGYVMDQAEWRQLVEIARQHDLILFADEIYRFLELRPEDTLPAACDLYENAVSLSGLSKTYGLAGLRIGWIATRRSDIYRAMASFKDFTSICNSAPSEFLAILALRHGETLARRNRAIVAANLEHCQQVFAQYPEHLSWVPPRGGSTAFPRLHHLDSEAFCNQLVEQQGVLLLPSRYFNFGDQHFRLGLGRKNFPEALARFAAFLRQV